MFLLKVKNYKKDKNKKVKELIRGNSVIEPNNDIEVIKYNICEVWGKGEFINYILSRGEVKKETLERLWTKMSKGYNFVIAIYKQNRKDYRIISVPYYNEVIGNGERI